MSFLLFSSMNVSLLLWLHLCELSSSQILSLVLCLTCFFIIVAGFTWCSTNAMSNFFFLPLFLRSVQLSRLFHQEYSRTRFFYKYYQQQLTQMIRMLLQLSHPCLWDGYIFLLRVIFRHGVSFLLCARNDALHVLVAQAAHQTEEEISFRQSPRQLLLGWQVFHQQFILHGILIQGSSRRSPGSSGTSMWLTSFYLEGTT